MLNDLVTLTCSRPHSGGRKPLTGLLSALTHHAYLLRPGDEAEHLHLVIDGWAGRYRLLNDGRRQITQLYVPGDLCDLSQLANPVARQHIIALIPMRTARIGRREAEDALHDEPEVRRLFWCEQCALVDSKAEWLSNLGRKSALERIAYLFCELTDRIGRVSDEAPSCCEMPLTQIDIADMTGLTPVHVNRVLQEMRGARLIELHARRLKIFDFVQLARLAYYPLRQFDARRPLRFRSLIDIVAGDRGASPMPA